MCGIGANKVKIRLNAWEYIKVGVNEDTQGLEGANLSIKICHTLLWSYIKTTFQNGHKTK